MTTSDNMMVILKTLNMIMTLASYLCVIKRNLQIKVFLRVRVELISDTSATFIIKIHAVFCANRKLDRRSSSD